MKTKTSKTIKLTTLIRTAQDVFNAFIRKRDADQQCITCPKYKIEHACHFYSAGQYSALRFNENNVHGGCLQCNYYNHGNLNEYRQKLIKRIGEQKVLLLDIAAYAAKKKGPHKWGRTELFGLIEHYKREIEKL